MKLSLKSWSVRVAKGFTLVDALFAMAIAGMMFVSMYAGLAFGFRAIKMARENTRATQVMLEKMETIRLYTWNQITNPSVFPTNTWITPYYSRGGQTSSLVYTGRITVSPAAVYGANGNLASYASEMRRVTIRVDWEKRTMSTYVTRNGLQNYVQ
jgi:type II secretory pathway pseudopilin PulG